jgi:hypothetical protein
MVVFVVQDGGLCSTLVSLHVWPLLWPFKAFTLFVFITGLLSPHISAVEQKVTKVMDLVLQSGRVGNYLFSLIRN